MTIMNKDYYQDYAGYYLLSNITFEDEGTNVSNYSERLLPDICLINLYSLTEYLRTIYFNYFDVTYNFEKLEEVDELMMLNNEMQPFSYYWLDDNKTDFSSTLKNVYPTYFNNFIVYVNASDLHSYDWLIEEKGNKINDVIEQTIYDKLKLELPMKFTVTGI